jgi:hypothetical protein
MAPGIEADDDIETRQRQLDGVDVAETKLRKMVEPAVVRPGLGPRMANGGDVHAKHVASELARQIARGPTGAAADVEHRRPGVMPARRAKAAISSSVSRHS